MAEYEEEQESRREQAADEAARFGARRVAKKAGPGAARGAAASGAGTTAGAAGTTGGVAAGGTAAGGAAAGGAAAGGAAAGGAAAGTAVAPGVGTAVGAAAGGLAAAAVKKAKYIIPAIIAFVALPVGAVLIIIIAVPVLVLALIFGTVEIGEATEGFTVTKTVSPDHLDNGVNPGDAADVTYTITVDNKLDVEVTGITLTDDNDIGCTIPDGDDEVAMVLAGEFEPVTYVCSVPTWPEDKRYTNTVTARGSAQYVDIDGNLAPVTVSDTANAHVIIGNPPDLPPTGCPIIGAITAPYGTNVPDYPESGERGDHSGVDISDGLNTPLRSTLTGAATLAGSSGSNCGYGVRVCNGLYCVLFCHLLDSGRVSGEVLVGDVIGTEDHTGYSTGIHVHYMVFDEAGDRQDPMQYMPVTLNYTPPPGLDFSGFAESPTGGWGSCDALP